MKQKKAIGQAITPQEMHLIEQLRQHPEIQARVESIMEIVRNEDGPLQTADEVEGLLIQELRRLGSSTMHQWANQAEERVTTELQQQDPTVLSRKKTLTWWCVFGLVEVRERIWCSPTQSYLRPLPKRLGVTPRGKSGRLERVLTDFGCEHSFARATQSVQEHYGFELGASAVRTATLKHAQRAQDQLQAGYREPFRILPAVGAAHVIGEADGTMICTVEPGPRKGKRPRQWKEMRLVAAQAQDSATTVYGATFGSVDQTGQRWGHCALALDLPIGSGMIESGHRHVLQARLKRAGTAWLRDHADQIAHLRVLRANHQWESLWN